MFISQGFPFFFVLRPVAGESVPLVLVKAAALFQLLLQASAGTVQAFNILGAKLEGMDKRKMDGWLGRGTQP